MDSIAVDHHNNNNNIVGGTTHGHRKFPHRVLPSHNVTKSIGEQHMEKIRHELLHVKQEAATYLVRSRTLEKTLLQYQASEAAIRQLTQHRPVTTAASSSALLLPSSSLLSLHGNEANSRSKDAASSSSKSRGNLPQHDASMSSKSSAATTTSEEVSLAIPYELGSHSAMLPESWLREIELICQLKPGYGNHLSHAYGHYSDQSMQDEIMQLTNTVSFEITSHVYGQICVACSHGKISSYDANALFQKSQLILKQVQSSASSTQNDRQIHWDILIHLLRKHLLSLHLCFLLDKLEIASRPKVFFKQKATTSSSSVATTSDVISTVEDDVKEAQAMNVMGNISPRMLNTVKAIKKSTVVKGNKKKGAYGSKMGSNSISLFSRSLSQALNASGSSDIDGSQPGNRFNKTMIASSELHESQAKQTMLSNKIMESLTQISKSVGLDPSKHKSAIEFSRRMGARKMEIVVISLVRREMIEAFARWVRFSAFQKTRLTIAKFQKHVCGGRLYFAILHNLQRKMEAVFRRWCVSNDWLEGHEILAAVIEIQRVWRGALSRYRFLQKVRELAAIMIQSIIRGHFGRRIAANERHLKQLKIAVRLIEEAWIRLRWSRLLKRRLQAERRDAKSRIIQRVYRGHAVRRRYRQALWERKQNRCAVKIQCLFRQYVAINVVLRLRLLKLQYISARQIQRIVRGRLGRRVFDSARHVRDMILRIQYAWWCYRARVERAKLYRMRCIIKIQSCMRMKLARKRVKEMRDELLRMNMRRMRSIRYLERFLLGFRTRRKYLPILMDFKQARHIAAVVLQARVQALVLGFLARQHVKRLRVDLSEAAVERRRLEHELKLALIEQEKLRVRQDGAARLIQRVERGKQGRAKAVEQRKEREKQARYDAIHKDRIPLYWRLQQDYLKHQNFFHKPFILKIQCAMRRKLARKRVHNLILSIAANKIKSNFASHHRVKMAKRELSKRKDLKRRRLAGAIAFQRIGRGYLVRTMLKRRKAAAMMTWFLQEWRAKRNTYQALLNFRKQRNAAIRIQSAIRRHITKMFFVRNHKRLVKERNKRVRLRRQRAAILMQGFARIIHCKKIMRRRKKEVQEERERRAMMDKLDENIEDIHSGWMSDLMAIRAQSGTRGYMGRQQAKKLKISAAEEEAIRIRQERDRAASRIQALARGVAARKLFKRIQPILRQQQRARQFCVECESKVATKRCRVCKDNYCDACFGLVHKRGTRQRHDWEPMRAEAAAAVNAAIGQDDTGLGGGYDDRMASRKLGGRNQIMASGRGAAANAPPAPTYNSRADWEQFYDANAKAKYWFNSKTGEASWTTPVFT